MDQKAYPFGTNLLFRCSDVPGLVVGCEICEDLWVAEPPSGKLARMGATVIANCSASDELIGKPAYRRSLIAGIDLAEQTARECGVTAFCISGAGPTCLCIADNDDIGERLKVRLPEVLPKWITN